MSKFKVGETWELTPFGFMKKSELDQLRKNKNPLGTYRVSGINKEKREITLESINEKTKTTNY